MFQFIDVQTMAMHDTEAREEFLPIIGLWLSRRWLLTEDEISTPEPVSPTTSVASTWSYEADTPMPPPVSRESSAGFTEPVYPDEPMECTDTSDSELASSPRTIDADLSDSE